MKHPAWLRFWLDYAIDGSKDDLINKGEIGLSQTLLAAGVELKPAYPLVHGLLTDQAMAAELQGYGRSQLEHVNQSLFAWQSSGCGPLVKKHVVQVGGAPGSANGDSRSCSLDPKGTV